MTTTCRSVTVRLAILIAAPLVGLVACDRSGALAELPDTASQTVSVYASECDQNDANACFAVGLAWWQADTNGQGLTYDAEQAARWTGRACDLGHEHACAITAQIVGGESPIGAAPATDAPTPHGVHDESVTGNDASQTD